MKKTPRLSYLGHFTALITFLIATILFGLYFFTGNMDFGFIGYMCFLFAVPINFIILIILAVKSAKTEESRNFRRGIQLMLFNIPVAIFCFGAGIYFTGVMRITIENTTGNDIEEIKIVGCEKLEFDLLKNGDSETVWINISGDCSISISYLNSKGEIQNETVAGYVTNGMGTKFTYRVGEREK